MVLVKKKKSDILPPPPPMYAPRGVWSKKIIQIWNQHPKKPWMPDDMHKRTNTLGSTHPPIMSSEIDKVPFESHLLGCKLFKILFFLREVLIIFHQFQMFKWNPKEEKEQVLLIFSKLGFVTNKEYSKHRLSGLNCR